MSIKKYCLWIRRISQLNLLVRCRRHKAKLSIIERGLKYSRPIAYIALVRFSKKNDCIIKEDRRSDFIEGIKRVKNKSSANVLTILLLTANLLSQNVIADNVNLVGQKTLNNSFDNVQIYPRVDFQTSSFSTSEQLMHGLLDWINENSSFKYKIEQLPQLTFVNQQIIAEVALVGGLPANVNASSLHVLGLYNFNSKTIYLLESVDLNTDVGRGILLHELVHYLQYEEHLENEVDCKNELEALAYTIEAKYLHEHNQEHNFSKQLINGISQCPI